VGVAWAGAGASQQGICQSSRAIAVELLVCWTWVEGGSLGRPRATGEPTHLTVSRAASELLNLGVVDLKQVVGPSDEL
jgi:hypothetical protein